MFIIFSIKCAIEYDSLFKVVLKYAVRYGLNCVPHKKHALRAKLQYNYIWRYST